jgi:glycerophosphoryl diester phosphodiesterase
MIETDVRRTPGGRLVLHHDPLSHTATGGLCGLADLVALAAGRVALDIELKEPGYEAEVLAVLTPPPAGLWVTSFLPGALSAVRSLDPAVATGLLVAPGSGGGDLAARARACGAGLLAPHVSLLDAGVRAAAEAAGLGLVVWTVNDRDRLADLVGDPAVECVITDEPELAVALRERAYPGSGPVSGGSPPPGRFCQGRVCDDAAERT